MTEFYFDTANGELLVGDEAIAQRREELDWAIVPLGELLLDKTFDRTSITPAQPFEHGQLTREDYLAYGAWAMRVISLHSPDAILLKDHFQRLNQLKLGSSFGGRFQNIFGRFTDFKRELGAPVVKTQNAYTDWSITNFVQYGEQVAQKIGRKPTFDDYNHAFRQGEGPSASFISIRFGDMDAYHEYLGYPAIRNWDKDDYIDWGVRALRANSNTGLTTAVISTLSRQHRGPSTRTVMTHFGLLTTFQRLVESELETRTQAEQQARSAKLEQYRQMVANGEIAWLAEDSEDALLRAGASRLIINRCAPNIRDDRKARLATENPQQLVRKLMQSVPGLKIGTIEVTAVSLQVFDDIWPMRDIDYEHLHVTTPRRTKPTSVGRG